MTSSYGYDGNGNLTSAAGTIQNRANTTTGAVVFNRTISYQSFNLPTQIGQTQASSTYTYTYTYGPDHERIKLITQRPDDTITSLYLHPDNTGGLRYERDAKATAGSTEHKYYVNSPAGLLGVFVVTATTSGANPGNTSEMRYFHRDHLGSITAISNEAGTKIETLAYEAFGERRNANGDLEDKTSPIIGVSSDRGYTGHEHLDELNLIHMNGRIYDPVLGRFMTADPFVQDPNNLQSYNRYAYCLNSPVGCTDPSGYFSLGNLFKAVAIAVISAYTGGAAAAWYAGAACTVATTMATATIAGIVGGAAGGFVGSFLASGGDFKAGVQGAFSGALFGAASSVGSSFSAERVSAHALAGCLGASAGGGNCAQGAISAATGKLTTGLLTEDGSWGKNNLNDFTRGVAVAGAGGLGSVLAGGKFDNGAKTAAFGYLFNQLSQGGPPKGGTDYCNSPTKACAGQMTAANEYWGRSQAIESACSVDCLFAGVPVRLAGATTTTLAVLGHYPQYVQTAERLGAEVFDVGARWATVNTAERWAANRAFLDSGISRGIPLVLSTDIRAGMSYYRAEVQYLLRNGYQYGTAGGMKALVK